MNGSSQHISIVVKGVKNIPGKGLCGYGQKFPQAGTKKLGASGGQLSTQAKIYAITLYRVGVIRNSLLEVYPALGELIADLSVSCKS